MNKRIWQTALILLFTVASHAQDIYPRNWWTGMKEPALQLMVHAKNIASLTTAMKTYPGVVLSSIAKTTNPNYLFLNLVIGRQAKPGTIRFTFSKGSVHQEIRFPLQRRTGANGVDYAKGVTAADLVYLIMPDRFSNGDTGNDRVAGLRDTSCDRNNPLLRHGGDLAGIIRHLGYLQALGVTALWLTPVIENDMPLEKEGAGDMSGYHGYWFTDHYSIDPRLGGSKAYHALVDSAHRRGLRIIQDAVYNHIGLEHWFLHDLPSADWINQWPAYQGTNHHEQTLFDIHGTAADKTVMTDGWFVPHLPDLNLRNPLLARFMIQNAIWMTETYKLDGWRVDTYKYCDEHFLVALNSALAKEFPSLSSFGEVTTGQVAAAAYFCENNMKTAFTHNGQGVTDFPLSNALLNAARPSPGNAEEAIYQTLAEDMLYREPMRNCIFLDNHDMNRFYSEAGEDTSGFQLGIGLLMTMRGIPQLYYGTEIQMKNFKNPSDAMVRADFPGGFPGDSTDKFSATGRNDRENSAFRYVQRLALFRQHASAIAKGKLMQYLPSEGLYVYFRYDNRQTVMCVLNTDTVSHPVDFGHYKERTTGFSKARDVVSGQEYIMGDKAAIPPRKIWVLELK